MLKSFNRTSLELKLEIDIPAKSQHTFNRTSLELKLPFKMSIEIKCILLIAPVWN